VVALATTAAVAGPTQGLRKSNPNPFTAVTGGAAELTKRPTERTDPWIVCSGPRADATGDVRSRQQTRGL